ncbi:MAG TPA: hypothetical protein VGM84_26415 [Steroidobacteraceae bacterium]|jgi:hypothetical protein
MNTPTDSIRLPFSQAIAPRRLPVYLEQVLRQRPFAIDLGLYDPGHRPDQGEHVARAISPS